MKKVFTYLKKLWWDDPYEQSATLAFGILCPFVILCAFLLTFLIK